MPDSNVRIFNDELSPKRLISSLKKDMYLFLKWLKGHFTSFMSKFSGFVPWFVPGTTPATRKLTG